MWRGDQCSLTAVDNVNVGMVRSALPTPRVMSPFMWAAAHRMTGHSNGSFALPRAGRRKRPAAAGGSKGVGGWREARDALSG